MDMIKAILHKRWGEEGERRAQTITEAFGDVNAEAVCRALLSYKGNYPPYPKDIEHKVYQLDIDGAFMKAVRRSGNMTREEQLSKIRERLRRELT